MLDKLNVIVNKLGEVSRALESPDVAANQGKYRELMREYKSLTPIAEKYNEYLKRASGDEEASAKSCSERPQEPEIKEHALRRNSRARKAMKKSVSADELKIMLLPRDPNDDRNVIVEIRGGTGGEEAALFRGQICTGCIRCTPS
jgi:peptide chain release factor 1